MSRLIKAHDNHNQPIINSGDATLPRSYFNIVRLKQGEGYYQNVPGYETCFVMWEGKCDIEVDGTMFAAVGSRDNIWENPRADSVYVPTGAKVRVKALTPNAAIAVAGNRCDVRYQPYRIAPKEVRSVEVGSVDTHSHRVIYHILGAKDEGRTGNFLICELYGNPGCWAGYPPHKHGDDIPSGEGTWAETGFEEVYHFRYNPDNGFGLQTDYYPDGSGDTWTLRTGDTTLISGGYHPSVTSPCHAVYVFAILAGHTQHSLVQNFDPEYSYLNAQLPGVQNMVDLYTGAQK